jgi:hypothetical protein
MNETPVFLIRRGVDFGPYRATINGGAFDLSGGSVAMKIKKTATDETALATFTIAIGTGTFDYSLTAAETLAIPSGFSGVTDAVFTDGAGKKQFLFSAIVKTEDVASL